MLHWWVQITHNFVQVLFYHLCHHITDSIDSGQTHVWILFFQIIEKSRTFISNHTAKPFCANHFVFNTLQINSFHHILKSKFLCIQYNIYKLQIFTYYLLLYILKLQNLEMNDPNSAACMLMAWISSAVYFVICLLLKQQY